MDDNVLKQFEGMPGVANDTNASTVPASQAQPQPQKEPTAPAASTARVNAPATIEVREFPHITPTPRVVRPATPLARTASEHRAEFKAIVPDPMFVRAGIKTLQEDVQENQENVALETLGRNPEITTPPRPFTPPAPRPNANANENTNASAIAQPFASIPRGPSVSARPTAASAFEAATATPTPTPRVRPASFETADAPGQNQNAIESLRTYERDVAQSIRGGESVMSINRAAQQQKEARQRERRELSEATELVARNSLKTIVSLVLVVGAVATLAIVFVMNREQAPVTPTEVQRTIISVDNTRDIKLSATNRNGIISATQEALKNNAGAPAVAQSLTRVKLLESGIVGTESAREISPNTFFKLVATNIPAALIRAFGNEWLFGFHVQKKNEPFLIVDISSFDNAYSGMLRWEQDMPADLKHIFLVNNVMLVTTEGATTTATSSATSSGTTTATTTPVAEKTVAVQIPLKKQFEDLIVKSRDTRVLKNEQGSVALLYAFIDTKYVVITTNEDTFREIMNRYLAAGLVR